MQRTFCTLPFLMIGTFVHAQCSVDLPSDTVTLYVGYPPAACTTLDPAVNGAAPTTLAWSSGDTAAALTVCADTSGWYYVTLTDDTLCTASDSVFVWVVDVRCGDDSNKVLVCHVPPGNPANAHTICISPNAVPAHLAHGCHLGACVADTVGTDTTVTDSIAAPGSLELFVSPNPMGALTTVRVRSSIGQHVRVEVVDATGRALPPLLDADLIAGEERTLVVQGTDLPRGTTAVWVRARGSLSGQRADPLILVR